MSKLPKDFLTVREAREAFSTLLRSEKTLRRLAKAERVRWWRVGGRILFSRAQLAADLAAMEVEAVAAPAGCVAVAGTPRDGFNNPRLSGFLK